MGYNYVHNRFKLQTLLLFGIFWNLILNLNAQILYDSPPVGVSLTRPILPWLARYFVGATNPETHFLDEPQRGPTEGDEDGRGRNMLNNGEGKMNGFSGNSFSGSQQQPFPPMANGGDGAFANRGSPTGDHQQQTNQNYPDIQQPPQQQFQPNYSGYQQPQSASSPQSTFNAAAAPIPVPVISPIINPSPNNVPPLPNLYVRAENPPPSISSYPLYSPPSYSPIPNTVPIFPGLPSNPPHSPAFSSPLLFDERNVPPPPTFLPSMPNPIPVASCLSQLREPPALPCSPPLTQPISLLSPGEILPPSKNFFFRDVIVGKMSPPTPMRRHNKITYITPLS